MNKIYYRVTFGVFQAVAVDVVVAMDSRHTCGQVEAAIAVVREQQPKWLDFCQQSCRGGDVHVSEGATVQHEAYRCAFGRAA